MQNQAVENAQARGHGMKSYIIDPRLEAVCLPLSNDEYDLLEKQIKRDGVLDAVKVWDRDGELVLLDGHNRLKICKDNKLPIPESTTVEIKCIDEAVIWICDNQKGRRNVATPKQQEYISGKRYEAQRNIDKFKGNQYTKESGAADFQPDQMDKTQHPTAFKQGLDEGIGQWKVRENARFAKGIDTIREVSPELADKILKPDHTSPTLGKGMVAAIPKLKQKLKNEPGKFVEAVKEIEKAVDTKDKKMIELVVRGHVSPDELTAKEKRIAKQHNVKPEHVRYAHEHNIPIENLKTVDQLAAIEARKPTSCATSWDGFYDCECGLKFEIFGSKCAPRWCPQCGKVDDLKRYRGG